MSNLDAAFTAAHATFEQVAGDGATYARGATTAEVIVVKARQGQRVAGETGVFTIGNRQDFIMEVAQLGDMNTPQRGDRITMTDSGAVYEVQPESGGSECWVFSDPALGVVRVHTVRRSA